MGGEAGNETAVSQALAATALPFRRGVVGFIDPDHRLCGRVSVSLSTQDSEMR